MTWILFTVGSISQRHHRVLIFPRTKYQWDAAPETIRLASKLVGRPSDLGAADFGLSTMPSLRLYRGMLGTCDPRD